MVEQVVKLILVVRSVKFILKSTLLYSLSIPRPYVNFCFCVSWNFFFSQLLQVLCDVINMNFTAISVGEARTIF